MELIDRDMDVTTAREVDGDFPRVEMVMPELDEYMLRISFDIKLLTKIAKGLNSQMIHMFSTGDKKDPYLVLAKNNTEDSFGLLMPIRSDVELHKNRPMRKLRQLKRSALEKESQEKGKAQ